MKFQVIGGGWPIGSVLIPAGTIIDLNPAKLEHELTEWERLARGRMPPPDCMALDDECYTMMWNHYSSPNSRHRIERTILRAPGVVG